MTPLLTTPAQAGARLRAARCWAPACAGVALMLGGCAAPQASPLAAVPAAPAALQPGTVTPGMQYLYGSGEAAAASMAAWRAVTDYVSQARRDPARAASTGHGVVLEPGSTLERPNLQRCGDKPLAAVFDVDETVLLNMGFESDDAAHPGRPYDERRWRAWEREGARDVVAVPGAVAALRNLRAMGVTVIFNTNRSAGNAAATQMAIEGAGLGPARHGETLFLQGDDATGSRKDARRAVIAARYCVVAMAGDQLGDFSDLFNAGLSPGARRAAVTSPALSHLWGAGWFVLPNPVYGTALRGGADDVFPADRRWSPAQEK